MTDGFQNPELVIPQGLPPRETITTGDFKQYVPPSTTLLSPPPGGVASVNTLPYKDPELEKAPYARLKNVLETANGFVQNEAIHMESMSDPSIQLPLTTLKADIRRLKDEVLVLERNPGIESTLTQGAVDGMEANLAYLQKKWRASANTAVEGFESGSASAQNRCTAAELNDLLIKIGTEITRLSASATTDPVTTQRIATLTNIKSAVQDIVTKVSSGQMAATDIPILESDYLAFLPVLGTDTALPSLLKANNLPPSLSSLFTSYQAGDISGAGITQYLFQNYADTFFKGLSWDLQMNYTSERTQSVADAKRGYAEAVVKALAPYRGEFASATMPDDAETGVVTNTGTNTNTNTASTGTTSTRTTSTGTASTTTMQDAAPAARLDWKDRSSQICTAIQNRGLEPGDFGCLTDTSAVGKGFSWRGYAKMVCTRLGTVYDTSTPEACGCPPLTWSGWRL